MITWIQQIPDVWKAIATAGAFAVAGWSGGLWVGERNHVNKEELDTVESSVAELKVDVASLQRDVNANTRGIDRMEVTLENFSEVLSDIRLNSCLTLAEVRGDADTDRCRR